MARAFRCIVIAEEECDGDVHEFDTSAELEAFRDGVSEGSRHYGAGSCSTYTVEDLPEAESDAPHRARLIRQYLLGETP